MERIRGDRVCVCNDVEKGSEVVHFLTPCSKHVLGEMANVVALAFVVVLERMNMALRAVDRVHEP